MGAQPSAFSGITCGISCQLNLRVEAPGSLVRYERTTSPWGTKSRLSNLAHPKVMHSVAQFSPNSFHTSRMTGCMTGRAALGNLVHLNIRRSRRTAVAFPSGVIAHTWVTYLAELANTNFIPKSFFLSLTTLNRKLGFNPQIQLTMVGNV